MSDYIELNWDDVIQKGDECQFVEYEGDSWTRCVSCFGVPVRTFRHTYRFRRPRHVAIRDAAIALLRELERPWPFYDQGAVESARKDLRLAIGATVEELRGEQ